MLFPHHDLLSFRRLRPLFRQHHRRAQRLQLGLLFRKVGPVGSYQRQLNPSAETLDCRGPRQLTIAGLDTLTKGSGFLGAPLATANLGLLQTK